MIYEKLNGFRTRMDTLYYSVSCRTWTRTFNGGMVRWVASKYVGPSDLTGKNQAGPTMFSAYQSESPVKICSLLRSGNNFLCVGPSNSVFKSRSFLQ
jgi:hypothetical protein